MRRNAGPCQMRVVTEGTRGHSGSNGSRGSRSGSSGTCNPLRPGSSLLVPLLLSFLSLQWRVASGQGLRSDSNVMGASARMSALEGTYKRSADLAASLRAGWSPAARSSCSAARGSLCGARLSDKALAADALLLAASPAAFDNRDSRNTGGFNPISAPGDQGDCNACVSFAVTAAAEAAIATALRASVPSNKVPRLSPRDLFFCGASGDGNDCTNGWTFRDGLSQLAARTSINSWQCLPFDAISNTASSAICKPACSSPTSPSGTFAWTRLQRFSSIAKIQEHIRLHGGVVTRLNLYKGFRSWFDQAGNKFGVFSGSPPEASYEQGHAVFVVGYNNQDKYWVVKNSWGTGWADGGFAKIKFGLLGMMDPEFTYGVYFQPSDNGLMPPPPSLTSLNGKCYSYSASPGDYASKVAQAFGVPIENFLADNAATINNMDAFFSPGQKLKVCNPTQQSVNVKAAAPAPAAAAAAAAAAPSASGGGGRDPCILYMGSSCGGSGGSKSRAKAPAGYDPNAPYMG